MAAQPRSLLRSVYLPLKELDKCVVCQKGQDLRLCSSCAEQIYCSAECQKKDWKSHKANCGKTDRIDLPSFYPFIAIVIDQCQIHKDKPTHPAMLHKIVNSPNPNTRSTRLSDGSAARVVVLGEPQPMYQIGQPSWWPTAASDKVRGKLMRRFMREGYLPHILTAVCMGLLAEVYTTTSGPGKRRLRLRHSSAPISDFGVAYGSVPVTPQDKLVYIYPDGTQVKGQDPNNHYWLYFTTIRGQEFTLECGMFTFNMCQMITTRPYSSPNMPMMPYAPAFYRDKVIQKSTPELHRERKRFTILRNLALQQAVANSEKGFTARDLQAVANFMEQITGKKPSKADKDLVNAFVLHSCNAFSEVVETERWKTFPAQPELAIETDPGEMDDEDDTDEDWVKYLENVKKMKKSGMGDEAVRQAFLDYTHKHKKKK